MSDGIVLKMAAQPVVINMAGERERERAEEFNINIGLPQGSVSSPWYSNDLWHISTKM